MRLQSFRAFASSLLIGSLLLSGCSFSGSGDVTDKTPEKVTPVEKISPDVAISISSNLASDFEVKDLENLQAVQDKWGAFSETELAYLSENKFLLKEVQDTKLFPSDVDHDYGREFLALYNPLSGNKSEYNRNPEDAVFLSADVFFNAYGNLYRELLKEMENTKFAPAMKQVSENFYKAAEKKLAAAKTDADKKKWGDVRNYFAIPYALLSNYTQPWNQFTKSVDEKGIVNYYRQPAQNGEDVDFAAKDPTADKKENVVAFINNLKLPAEDTKKILADVDQIYAASENGIPAIFQSEYEKYNEDVGASFKVAFSLFTPRADYTGTSQRRQYFRAMQWFSQIPFFVKSAQLTTDAFAITQLMADDAAALKSYSDFEEAINFMVGESDDLTPVDYLVGLKESKNAADKEAALMDFLVKARNPQIKGMPVDLPTVGEADGDALKLATKGMRFFSSKFVIDSGWTDYLTQGDEAIQSGYTQKLPPLASALQIMNLLGSKYAGEQISKLDFYKPETKEAIDQAMKELTTEVQNLSRADWEKNLYMGWLDVIHSLFGWQQYYLAQLPRFMQSESWAAKTLMTGAAFWTELRHATLLYAKQSFAELGGGGGEECDKFLPKPAKGYIEPQYGAYTRLLNLATNTEKELKNHGYDLVNLPQLQMFTTVMQKVISYTKQELADMELTEKITTTVTPYDAAAMKKDGGQSYEEMGLDTNHDGKCTVETLDGVEAGFGWIKTKSDWEMLRYGIISGLGQSLPQPIDGKVLPPKDKRAAVVADIHTGVDSNTPAQIVYEGVGVPRVIFVAVKDANGARLTTGIVYSQYEFRQPAEGQRLTDEDWQKNFYDNENEYDAYKYTDKADWPEENPWYDILFAK